MLTIPTTATSIVLPAWLQLLRRASVTQGCVSLFVCSTCALLWGIALHTCPATRNIKSPAKTQRSNSEAHNDPLFGWKGIHPQTWWLHGCSPAEESRWEWNLLFIYFNARWRRTGSINRCGRCGLKLFGSLQSVKYPPPPSLGKP